MILGWLQEEGPHARKHHGWAHPIAVLLCHYIVLVVVAFGVHDWLVVVVASSDTMMMEGSWFDSTWAMTDSCISFRQQVAGFLTFYSLWFLPWRLLFCNPQIPRNTVL